MAGLPVDLAQRLQTDPSCGLLRPRALFLDQACFLGGLGVRGEPRWDASVLMELLARSHACSSSFPCTGGDCGPQR